MEIQADTPAALVQLPGEPDPELPGAGEALEGVAGGPEAAATVLAELTVTEGVVGVVRGSRALGALLIVVDVAEVGVVDVETR